MLNRWTGIELKRSADIVRTTWDGWLTLLIRAENDPRTEQYVCVIRTSLDHPEQVHIAMGDAAHIGKVAPPTEPEPLLIRMRLLLHQLRPNAAAARLKL